MWKFVIGLGVFLWKVTAGYKILLVYPVPGRSHAILGDGFVKPLLEAGHEGEQIQGDFCVQSQIHTGGLVTYITPYPVDNPHPNLHQVDVSENFKYFPAEMISIKNIIDSNVDQSANLFKIFEISAETIRNKNVQDFMRDPKQEFDLIVVEWMFTDIYAGFSAVFNAPYIWSSSVEPHWMVLELIDEVPNPAYNSDILSYNVSPLGFAARVQELGAQVLGTIFKKFYLEPRENALYNELFSPAVALKGRTLPPLEVTRYNASLMLGNSHVSLGEAMRLPENYKSIAGYHINPKLEPLPEGLKKLIEHSKDGVIYFSMGSNLKSTDWPESLKRELLEMFGGLKQTVLWKFEEELANRPKNVHILKWAPQPSILAHPNVLLFITHGGLLSTTETVYYGKPIIGIPVFADQFTNVGRAVNKGFAVKVDVSYNVAADLKAAIQEVLSNSKYTETVKQLSYIYHDRPVSPVKEIVHWMEHVIKTKGAPHLRSPALMVSWYQKLYLDLAALVAAIIYVITRILCALSQKKKKIDSDKKRK